VASSEPTASTTHARAVTVASDADTALTLSPVAACATASGGRCASRLIETAPPPISWTVSASVTATGYAPGAGRLASSR
jgi:hypothetical protein